jgi:HMG box factor, other
MVMSIPFLNKIKVLRRVAPPIPEPSPASPGPRIRGTILAVEGDDPASVNSVLTQLSDSLRRCEEFDLRTMTGPKIPEGKVELKDFVLEIASWHDKTKHMVDFVTGAEYQRQGSQNGEREAHAQQRPVITIPSDEESYDSMSEGEILEGARKESYDTKRKPISLSKQKIKVEEEELRTATAASSYPASTENPPQIPLLLISNYILRASNIWSFSIPITDNYSPADHFTWISTLWRGIVGADLTVYVRSSENLEVEAMGGGEKEKDWPGGMMTGGVEMKEDGTIVVRREKGRVDEAKVRRVSFEVGEFVRRVAEGHS